MTVDGENWKSVRIPPLPTALGNRQAIPTFPQARRSCLYSPQATKHLSENCHPCRRAKVLPMSPAAPAGCRTGGRRQRGRGRPPHFREIGFLVDLDDDYGLVVGDGGAVAEGVQVGENGVGQGFGRFLAVMLQQVRHTGAGEMLLLGIELILYAV